MDRRRRRYVINRRFQYKLIASFVGVALLAFGVSTSAILCDVNKQIQTRLQSADMGISKTGEIILPVAVKTSAAVMAVYLLVILALVIYYALYARGVIGVFDAGLERFRKGELGFELGMDKSTDFGHVAREFDEMLLVNMERIDSLGAAAEELEAELARLAEPGPGKAPDEEAVRSARKKFERLEGILSGYTV